jgi:hypothetical protein
MEPHMSRPADLAMIQSAVERMLGRPAENGIGLSEIADVCRSRAKTMVERDCHEARDALLTIACEWDLTRDRLEDQSDACIAVIADLLST